MAFAVLTVDQRSSRTQRDLVPDLVVSLNSRSRTDGPLRQFERTAGDEAQGIFSSAKATVDSISTPLRTHGWNEAVNRAKSGPHHVNVVGADPYRAEQVETALWLWSGLLAPRTDRGWEVADLLAHGVSHREAGDRLGISQSAVTQRAQSAGIADEQRVRRLASQLLTIAALVTLTGILALLTLLGAAELNDPEGGQGLVWFLSGALAAAGGGPVTVTVLWLVDRGGPADNKDSVQQAGEVLRWCVDRDVGTRGSLRNSGMAMSSSDSRLLRVRRRAVPRRGRRSRASRAG